MEGSRGGIEIDAILKFPPSIQIIHPHLQILIHHIKRRQRINQHPQKHDPKNHQQQQTQILKQVQEQLKLLLRMISMILKSDKDINYH